MIEAMRVSVTVKGLDDFVSTLQLLTSEVDPIFRAAIYEGMDVVADTMRESVSNLKTSKQYKLKGARYCTENEKKGLVESFGVTPISFRNGTYDVKAGFDGYNPYVKSHPANPMIANFINRGTSYMKAQRFISSTERKSKDACIGAMEEKLAKEIDRLM